MEELRTLPEGTLQGLLVLAMAYIRGDFAALQKVKHSQRAVFTKLVEYLRAKAGLHATEYSKEVEEEGWPEPTKQLVLSALQSRDSEFGRKQNPDALADLCWKIDVALSTNSLSKVLRPEIHLRVGTPSETADFHMTLQQFQELRRQTAVLVKDVYHLDQFPFVRNLK